MKKIAITALLAYALAFAQAQDNSATVTGKWKIHATIAGNDADSTCTFAQSGNDLSGTCPGPQGEVKLTGKVDGKKVIWSYQMDYNGSPLTMKYEGTLDAGRIVGSVNVDPFGVSGDMTADPSTEAEPAAAPASAPGGTAATGANASVGGKWKVLGSIAGTGVNSECTFTQTGVDLVGTCVRTEGSTKISGKVNGQKVTWQYDIDYNGNPLTMKYDGTLGTGKISGTITVVQMGAGGDFNATLEN